MNSKYTLFAVGIICALALTISCSTDNEHDDTPSSSSIISISSSSSILSSSSSSSLFSSSSSYPSSSSQAISYGVFTDNRDGQTYQTVDVGTRIWMVENLNYETSDSYCYNNLESNCDKYGRLYERTVANTACPSGWHLPNDDELEEMKALIEDNDKLLYHYGFTTKAGGFINPDDFYQNEGVGYWWAYGGACKHYRADPFFKIGSGCAYGYYFSVRCVKMQDS